VRRPLLRPRGPSALRRLAQGLADLFERPWVLYGRQIARIAALGQRLDRPAQQLARAGLWQQRDKVHCAGSSNGAELPIDSVHHFIRHRRHTLRGLYID